MKAEVHGDPRIESSQFEAAAETRACNGVRGRGEVNARMRRHHCGGVTEAAAGAPSLGEEDA